MTILPNNPFADLGQLRSELNARIQRRSEILQNINQGESTVVDGLQQASAGNIELFGAELPLKMLQEQRDALDTMLAHVKEKQDEIEIAKTDLNSIDIEAKKAAINETVGMGYLQQADVALAELNIDKLDTLLVNFDQLTLEDATLLVWRNELQADQHLLSTLKNDNLYTTAARTSKWKDLQSCMESLVRDRVGLDNDQWRFLNELSKEHPDSRLLSKYKWLNAAYPKKDTKQTIEIPDLQTNIEKLVHLFETNASTETLEQQLGKITRQIKIAASNESTMSQLVNIFVMPFTNGWMELIHNSEQFRNTLTDLEDIVKSIRSQNDLIKHVKRVDKLIMEEDEMAFYLHTQKYMELLDKLRQKASSSYPKRQGILKHIRAMEEKAKKKQQQGERQFNQLSLTKQ